MRHSENALEMMKQSNELSRFIEVSNMEDIKGVPPVVHFAIQSDPISEVGVNGCQARDMLEYVMYLFRSLDDAFPCKENMLTIVAIKEAISYQDERTKDREARKVEGRNEA